MKRQLLDQRKSCYIYKQIFDIYLCLYRYTKRAQKPSRLTVNTKNTQSFSLYNTIYVATISSDFRYLHRVSETVFQNIKLVQNTYEIDQIKLSEKKSCFFLYFVCWKLFSIHVWTERNSTYNNVSADKIVNIRVLTIG